MSLFAHNSILTKKLIVLSRKWVSWEQYWKHLHGNEDIIYFFTVLIENRWKWTRYPSIRLRDVKSEHVPQSRVRNFRNANERFKSFLLLCCWLIKSNFFQNLFAFIFSENNSFFLFLFEEIVLKIFFMSLIIRMRS